MNNGNDNQSIYAVRMLFSEQQQQSRMGKNLHSCLGEQMLSIVYMFVQHVLLV